MVYSIKIWLRGVILRQNRELPVLRLIKNVKEKIRRSVIDRFKQEVPQIESICKSIKYDNRITNI